MGRNSNNFIHQLYKGQICYIFLFHKHSPSCPSVGICREGHNMLTQYEITHMENLMVRDDYWQDDDEEDP